MNDKELLILVSTTLFLIILSYLYYKKNTKFKIGLYILLIYTVASIMSIIYVFQPYSWLYLNGQSQWWPILYWMILFLITCLPIFKFDKLNFTKVDCNLSFLYKICTFGFIISIIPFFEQLALAHDLFSASSVADVALELHDEADLEGLSIISRNLLRVNIAIYDLSFLALLLLFLQKKKNRFAIFCVLFIIATRNLTGIIVGHRSSFIEVLQKLILVAFITFPLQNAVQKKKMLKIVAFSFAIFFGFFLLITIGRAMSYNESNSEFTLIAFLSRYMGEQFLLFNEYLPLMKETSGGELTCWYFMKILGMDVNDLTNDYMYFTLTNLQGIPQNVFYSYIGNFVQDFGFFATAIILPILSLIFTFAIKTKNNTISLSTLFLFVFYASIIMRGVTSYPYCGTHGKFVIFSLIVYFILRYVERKKGNIHQTL